MKKILFIIMFSSLVIGLSFCQKSPIPTPEKTIVATSLYPIYDITKNITGDKADVFFVVPIGANPHTYNPVPSTVIKLKNIHLFIGVHNELDGWIADYLPEQTILKFLKEESHKENTPEHESEHREKHKYEHNMQINHHSNPHIWLTIKGTKKSAENIAHYLSDIDPKNAQYYQNNLHLYLKELDNLDKRIASLFQKVKNRKFIQWHPAWDFLAEDYGLEIVGEIEKGHGYEPSVKEFKELVDKALKEDVHVIVIGLNVESKATVALAREINGIVVRLDSIGDPKVKEKSSYIQLMYYNAKKLSEALNQ